MFVYLYSEDEGAKIEKDSKGRVPQVHCYQVLCPHIGTQYKVEYFQREQEPEWKQPTTLKF